MKLVVFILLLTFLFSFYPLYGENDNLSNKFYLDDEMFNKVTNLNSIDDLLATPDEVIKSMEINTPVISDLSGDIKVISENGSYIENLTIGKTIPFGSEIRCSENSKIEVIWPEGTVLKSEYEASFVINRKNVYLNYGDILIDFPGSEGGFFVDTEYGRATCIGTFFSAFVKKIKDAKRVSLKRARWNINAQKLVNFKVFGGRVKFTNGDFNRKIETGNKLTFDGVNYTVKKISEDIFSKYNKEYTLLNSPKSDTITNRRPTREITRVNEEIKEKLAVIHNDINKIRKNIKPNFRPQGALMSFGKPVVKPVNNQNYNEEKTYETSITNNKPTIKPFKLNDDIFKLIRIYSKLSEANSMLIRLTLPNKTRRRFSFLSTIRNLRKIASRGNIHNKMMKEKIFPYRSDYVPSCLAKYSSILERKNKPKTMKEKLVYRISRLYYHKLPSTIRRVDRYLVRLNHGRNSLMYFKSFERLVERARVYARFSARKKASRMLEIANRIRKNPLLNSGKYPRGASKYEISRVNSNLEILRKKFDFGKELPKGWGNGNNGNFDREKSICMGIEKILLKALIKYGIKDRITVPKKVSTYQLIKYGFLGSGEISLLRNKNFKKYSCPSTHKEYAMYISPIKHNYPVRKDNFKNNIKMSATVSCRKHGKISAPFYVSVNDHSDNRKICKHNMKLIEDAVRSYYKKYHLRNGTNVSISGLVSNGFLKEAPKCPEYGVYSIMCGVSGEVKVSCSVHKYGDAEVISQPANLDSNGKICKHNMKMIGEAVKNYYKKYHLRNGTNVSISGLVSKGFLKEAPKCPEYGVYTILCTGNGKVGVSCSVHKCGYMEIISQPTRLDSDDKICKHNMNLIKEAVRSYYKKYHLRNGTNVSISGLVSKGFLKEAPKCPKYGVYTIVCNANGEIEVSCSVHRHGDDF